MSTTQSNLPITVTASGAVTQHLFVGYDGAVVAAAANTLGVARTPAADGEQFLADAGGIVTVRTGGAIAIGEAIETDANGRAVAFAAGTVVARAIQSSAAADELIEVRLIAN